MAKFGESILRICTNVAAGHPWLVIILTVIVTIAASAASVHLTIDTSTENILSEDLPFRQVEIDYRKSFPQDDLAIAVVDAPSSSEADAAGRDLAARLSARPAAFEWAELAGSSPYFDRYGLLFLAPEKIAGIAEQLRPARRVLTQLANDPTLRGAAGFLSTLETGVSEGVAPASAADLITDLAATVTAQAEGRAAEMQWRGVFGADAADLGTRRIVQMKPILDDSTLDRAGPALAELDAAIAEVESVHPGVSVAVTGEPVLRQQELDDAFSGAVYASMLSFVLVALSLIIGIRSGRLIVALIVALVIGSIWTTGLAAVTVGRLNLISVAFLVLFFGIGIDFGTHLGLRYLDEVKTGRPFREALLAAMLGEGPAITLSALGAALAFLAFLPTSYVGLAEFGIISALGMLVAVVVTFLVQPALMALMPPRRKPGREFTIGLGGWIERHHRGVLVAAAVATGLAAYFSVGMQIDTNPLNLQNPDTEPVQTYRDLARDPDTSPYALDAVVANREAAEELAPQLAELPGVSGVRWIGSFVPSDQPARLAALQAARERLGEAFLAPLAPLPEPSDAEVTAAFASMRADAEAIASMPPDGPVPVEPEIVAAGRTLSDALTHFAEARGSEPAALRDLGKALTGQVPALVADLQQKLSVDRAVTVDDMPEELRREWLAPDGRARLRVLPAGDIGTPQAMRAFTERVQAVTPEVAGAPASVAGAGDAILRAFAEAIIYTVVSIGLLVVLLRRRLSDVFLVLAPLGIAALWTVAVAALLDMPFNFANIIVIPMIIGLGVASSVHIVNRAHQVVSDASGTHEEGMHVLDTSTPLAVLVAQLNTVAAFATLAVADHRGLFSMGVLLGIAIFFVLIVSLVVLPAFMIAVGIGKPAPAAAPEGTG